jgi:hypothetical protein
MYQVLSTKYEVWILILFTLRNDYGRWTVDKVYNGKKADNLILSMLGNQQKEAVSFRDSLFLVLVFP